MLATADWYDFAAPSLLAAELANVVAGRLRDSIRERGEAVLAVSGGSTPATFFRVLARKQLDWNAVTVTLIDERFVPPTSFRSNERLVKLNLLQANASAARFVGLYDDEGIDDAAARAIDRLSSMMQSIDVTVLGMGTDGHTASFFADAGNLDALLDPDGGMQVLSVQSETAGEPRLTLTLGLLKSARHTYVHIEGRAKRELLADILAERKSAPIGTVLEKLKHPADIYWAPGDTK